MAYISFYRLAKPLGLVLVLFIALSMCVLGCKKEKKEAETNDSSSSAANNEPLEVNVYLENSFSMDAYVGVYGKQPTTRFRNDVSSLVNTLKPLSSDIKLFYIDDAGTTLEPDKNIVDVIKNLSLDTLLKKASSRKARENTMFLNVLDKPLQHVSSSGLSLLISDFIISIPTDKNSYENDIKIFIDGISDKIYHLLKERMFGKDSLDLSLLVLRMESDFHACYYTVKNECIISKQSLDKLPKNGKYFEWRTPKDSGEFDFVRPYFVWIIGTSSQIERVEYELSKSFSQKNFEISKFISYDKPEYQVKPYPVSTKYVAYKLKGAKKDSIVLSKIGKDVRIPIKIKLPGTTWNSEGPFADTAAYIVESKFFRIDSIARHKDAQFTHVLILKSNEAFKDLKNKAEIESFFIKTNPMVKANLFEEHSSFKEDLNTLKEGKTFGLNSLMDGLKRVFYEKNLNSIEIKIGVE
ncbi:hypothetical protein R83H12_00012 [Fibrobacteria bacterium R8-3-H12]